MNCREAQSQIFAERDGALENSQRVALDGHLTSCGDCRRIRENLTASLTAWRIEVIETPVPDAEREWHAVRRRIRGGAEAGAVRDSRPRRNLFAWVGIPLGAAAALAFGVFVSSPSSSTVQPGERSGSHVARANSVEVPGNNATTMVFVDDKSGVLFVLAADGGKRG